MNTLAIIIPYYKIIFFEETLNSIANQTNKKFNLYIFDDDSPEDPKSLIDQFIDQLNISYKKFDVNFGGQSLVKHWYRCLENITEDWFCILGDDDILDTNFVNSFYNNIDTVNEQKINLIRYSSVVINDKGKEITPTYHHPILENSIDSLVRKLKGNNRSSLSEFIYRNVSNRNNHFIDFPNAYYSDDLSLLLASNFAQIFSINTSVFKFRKGNYNLSGVNSDLKKGFEAEFLFYKYLFNNHSLQFNIEQKRLFLHKLNRLVIRTKSLKIYLFMIKQAIKIYDISAIFYLSKVVVKKLIFH